MTPCEEGYNENIVPIECELDDENTIILHEMNVCQHSPEFYHHIDVAETMAHILGEVSLVFEACKAHKGIKKCSKIIVMDNLPYVR